MPIKRRPPKGRLHPVTPELEKQYTRAVELYAVYSACNRKTGHCRVLAPNQKCARCVELFNVTDAISTALDLKPWQTIPWHADSLETALAEMTDPMAR